MQSSRQLLFSGNRIYLYLLIGTLFTHLASYLIIPIFPVFLETSRLFSLSQVGLILGVSSFANQLASLVGGILADRLGQRTIMIMGASCQGVAMIGYGFSQAFPLFLLFAIISGIGVGLYAPTLKAMIAHTVGPKNRTLAFSWRGIAANIGIIIAGLAVALLALASKPIIFILAASVFFLVVLFTIFALPNDRLAPNDSKPVPLTEYRHILRHYSFLFFSAVSLMIWALYAQLALVLPLRGAYVLGSTDFISLIWTINSLVVVLSQGIVARLILQRLNPYISLIVATLLIGGGLFSLGWSANFVTLSLSAIIFIIGEMMLLPIMDSLVGYFATEGFLGSYFGLANLVAGLGTAIGTSLGGRVVEQLGGIGSRLPWIAYGVVTLIFALVLLLFAYYAMPRYGRGRISTTLRPSSGKEKEKVK